jgi:uncharacterized protein YndB with AHSA1/START domain
MDEGRDGALRDGMAEDRIVREVLLPAARKDVWEAITRPDRLAEWFGGRVEIDPVPRGRIEHRAPDGSVRRGAVLSADRPIRLVFWWQDCGEDETLDPGRGDGTRVEFVLLEDAEGTLLTVTETHSPDPLIVFGGAASSIQPTLMLAPR